MLNKNRLKNLSLIKEKKLLGQKVEITTLDSEFVKKDQIIAEIDSDKATLELPAEESGVISLSAEEGDGHLVFIAPAHESLLFHPILVWYAALHWGLKSPLYCQLLSLLCCKKVSVVENSPLTPVLFTSF